MKSNQFVKILSDNLNKNIKYCEASDFVKKVGTGNIWLIGSAIYITLINKLYNQSFFIKDFDFIVDKIETKKLFNFSWEIKTNRHGNLKLIKGDNAIDLITLDNIHSIKSRNLRPNIDNYLSGTPLNIQSIAFDIRKNEIIGTMGIEAILNRKIEINNPDEYDYARNIYGDRYSLEKYASKINFYPIK